MKEFSGVIRNGDYDTYVTDTLVWEAFLTKKITGSTENGGGRLTMNPGAKIGPYARKEMEELWFVLSGSGEFAVWNNDKEDRRTVRQNHLIYIRKGQKHEVKNTGNLPLRFTVFFPASGPETDFLKGENVRLIPAAPGQ